MWLKKFLIIALFSAFMMCDLSAQNDKIKTVEKQKTKTISTEKQSEEVEQQKKSANKSTVKSTVKSSEKNKKSNEKKNFEKKVHQQIVNQNKKQNAKKQALQNKKEKNTATLKQQNSSNSYNSSKNKKTVKTSSTKKIEKSKSPVYSQTSTKETKVIKKTKSIKKTPAFDSKNQQIEQKKLVTNQHEIQKKPRVEKKKIHQGSGYHQPHVVIEHQHVTYSSPRYYHYHVPPGYIYRGVWIRYYMDFPNGYIFYNGYPYFVYNNYMHRYSVDDKGYFDLVDSWNDETYATFYGDTIKDSYDRCADLRDRLNAEYGEERYFCSERFEYDPDYKYGWDPDDFPDWYWY